MRSLVHEPCARCRRVAHHRSWRSTALRTAAMKLGLGPERLWLGDPRPVTGDR